VTRLPADVRELLDAPKDMLHDPRVGLSVRDRDDPYRMALGPDRVCFAIEIVKARATTLGFVHASHGARRESAPSPQEAVHRGLGA
jgi:hypothetical protein